MRIKCLVKIIENKNKTQKKPSLRFILLALVSKRIPEFILGEISFFLDTLSSPANVVGNA